MERKEQRTQAASGVRQATAGLIAGVLGNLVNMALLDAASAVGMTTAHGGLLRLVEKLLERLVYAISIIRTTPHEPLLPVGAAWIQTAFHFGTGLGMAELYAMFLESRLPAGKWRQAILYGGAVWLFNSLLVLPLIGEGFWGTRHLRLEGIVAFALAHMAFFFVLCLTYPMCLRMLKSRAA